MSILRIICTLLIILPFSICINTVSNILLPAREIEPLSLDDLQIGPLKCGEKLNFKEAKQIFGKPCEIMTLSVKKYADGYYVRIYSDTRRKEDPYYLVDQKDKERYFYGHTIMFSEEEFIHRLFYSNIKRLAKYTKIETLGDRIKKIETAYKNVKTNRGLKIGDDAEKIIKLYGRPEYIEIDEEGGLIRYRRNVCDRFSLSQKELRLEIFLINGKAKLIVLEIKEDEQYAKKRIYNKKIKPYELE